MLIPWYKIKTICSFNYRDRGRHSRERNYDIKHRTDFGRWLIKRRNKN